MAKGPNRVPNLRTAGEARRIRGAVSENVAIVPELLTRETIAKIVRSDEMQAHVQKMREGFYGFGCDARDAVPYALCKKYGPLGYRFLVDIGVVPTQEERQIRATQPVVPEKNKSARVFEIVLQLIDVARERAWIFGMPMSELEA